MIKFILILFLLQTFGNINKIEADVERLLNELQKLKVWDLVAKRRFDEMYQQIPKQVEPIDEHNSHLLIDDWSSCQKENVETQLKWLFIIKIIGLLFITITAFLISRMTFYITVTIDLNDIMSWFR
jgi:hypothetical protein